MRTRVPVKSNSAAFFARAKNASIGLVGCAEAPEMLRPAAIAIAVHRRDFMDASPDHLFVVTSWAGAAPGSSSYGARPPAIGLRRAACVAQGITMILLAGGCWFPTLPGWCRPRLSTQPLP